MNKQKVFGGLILFALLMVHFQAFGETNKSNLDLLVTFAEQMDGFDVGVEEWTFLARDTIADVDTKSAYQQFAQSFIASLGESWYVTEAMQGDPHQKITASRNDPQWPLTETITILRYSGEGDRDQVHMMYHVQSQSLDDLNWKMDMVSERQQDIGLGEAATFISMRGTVPSLDRPLETLAVEMLESFGAKKVEALVEDSFLSISAFHSKWQPSIELGTQDMNLQIALRQKSLGEQTTVTFGTPIITTEY
ncbi:YwmB family TATA-box binding protein [Halalkalibacterium halodurans]|uniref:BH3750 protein n=1 Tax=Halalkalibacterium halodurans (strain ATCC BAA-125 / DSM 18197 / FERM 7344 / JCM 9153 / C-125) TaxID=272558 RepID=Q9K6H9_HALH5|nr:YwmB family TATA-box binding protein [Halalkalibacterium halodurans]MED4174795.1 YwmB family TATA-box binding protein [Halalkalibacterium halodurans]BAB07469.1 BH3750 [Halalkalibacterium halodurans C-125]